MSGDKPRLNGGSDDVEMNDSSNPKKNGKGKDGDEEMTVVVPPSKNGKASDDTNGKDSDKPEEEIPVDPKDKALQGEFHTIGRWFDTNDHRNQGQFCSS